MNGERAHQKMVTVFLTKIIFVFEAISEVDPDEESNWVRCHLKEHILVHNPTKGEFKIPRYAGKKWRGNHEHSHYLETALTFCISLVQANSWEHVKSIGVGIFSLARRDQLPKALWKYPSHPLLDSANRGGVACIFITPERSASNEPHAYFVFCSLEQWGIGMPCPETLLQRHL